MSSYYPRSGAAGGAPGFSKVFDKISRDIYVDRIGSGLVDNIVGWAVLKRNCQKTLIFLSVPMPGSLSGALSLVLPRSTISKKD